MNNDNLYIKNLKQYFDFLSNIEKQKQEWILKPTFVNFSYDETYYDFMDILCGRFMLENNWNFLDETIHFSSNLKNKLYHFSILYHSFFMNENYEFTSNEQYYALIIKDKSWNNLTSLANEIRNLLDTDIIILN